MFHMPPDQPTDVSLVRYALAMWALIVTVSVITHIAGS